METPGITAAPSARTSHPLAPKISPLLPGSECAFRGIIALGPAVMRPAGVAKVECPECTTMRSLPLRGATVRFPPHDKRKTRTPAREARWVKRGAAWELVGP